MNELIVEVMNDPTVFYPKTRDEVTGIGEYYISFPASK